MYKTFTQPLPLLPSTHTGNTRLTTSLFTNWLKSITSIFFFTFWLWGSYARAQAPSPNLLLKGTSASSTDNSDSRATAVDASGNTYMAGRFSGTVTFGSTTLTSAGADDIFIAKYNSAGAFQWATRAGGTGTDIANGIAVSGSDVYITGYFNETANFNNPSATGSNEIMTAGGYDIFLAKYNSAGDYQWATRAGGTGTDIANGIAVSGSDVYITGYFNETANFNNPSSSSSNTITSAGSQDIFLAKYNSAGVYQWATRAGGTEFDNSHGVAVSGSDVFITGRFEGTANFNNPSSSSSNTITSAGSSDIFLAKYSDAGAFQWAKRAGGTSAERALGIAVSGGDVYITGIFESTANFNNPSSASTNTITSAGGNDIFLAKYTNAGVYQWAKRAGGASTDDATGIAVSGSDVYITGIFEGTANFNTPSATGSNEIVSAGSNDVFLAKYSDTGAYQWAKRGGGTGSDQANGIAVSGSDVYITGSFRGTANFNTPSATGSNELTTVAFKEAFLVRYVAPPKPFITRWDLSKAGSNPTTLFIGVATSGTVNYTWTTVPSGTTGSGTFSGTLLILSGLPANAIIDLSIAPTNFQRINIALGTDRQRLTEIKQWGDVAWTSMNRAFSGCTNMTLTATDVPILTGVTDMSVMFGSCSSFNQALPEGFNTSNVTNMSFMFFDCSAYNQALPSSFNTSAVTNMSNMFNGCTVYNKALPNSFNTSAVTDMSRMFISCAAFDQSVSNYNTTNVTDMSEMFRGCGAFNQSVSNFNTANVTTMNYMFSDCSAFDQSVSNFNTAKVVDMGSMFYRCTIFNKPVSNFNTANVTNMGLMFENCAAFNQSVSNFNTANVSWMNQMFNGCTNFNQSLATFTLKANVNLNLFLNNSGLNTANYDATLTAFNAQNVTGRTMGATGLKYCASEAARANLVLATASGGKGWTITGDIKICPPTITTFPANACVGSTITITGTNLTGATAVSIGGVAVTSFTVNSATQITATVASGNTGTISVTTPNGVGVSSSSFTALSTPPIPTISGNTEICEGLGTTLYASSNFYPESSITYGWTDGLTGGLRGSSFMASPLTTRTYRVATTADGCTSDSSDVFTLTVHPKPATPSITADNMTICKGGNVLLTGSCSTANASFRWTTPAFNNGNQTSALPSTNLRTITEPGTYKGLCESDKGCLSDEFSITINQATDCSGLNFITITPERPAICPGQSIVMTATGCAGTLTWLGGTSTPTGASVTLSPATTTTYLVQCSTGGSGSFKLVVAATTLAVDRHVATDKERFKAVTTLTSDKKVGNATFTPGANVIYEAGNSITLLPGFTAEKWSTFTAEIKTCPQD